MKHWKKLLSCLLAGVLTLALLTACSGGGSTGGVPSLSTAMTYTSAETGKALAEALDLTYSTSLQSTAKSVADWVASSTALRTDGTSLIRRVALDDENTGYWERNDLNNFLYYSRCYAPVDATMTLGMTGESNGFAVDLYLPSANGAEAVLQSDFATGKSEMGVAFVNYAGLTYVVAVFQ